MAEVHKKMTVVRACDQRKVRRWKLKIWKGFASRSSQLDFDA
jgi:hypothetical protein